MADLNAIRNRKPDAVRADIERLLQSDLVDVKLRDQLEELAVADAFGGFTWLWGPVLYRRNRVVFRPFILNRFSNWLLLPRGRLERVAWKGDAGSRLDAWFAEVDAVDDVPLFRRLYPWKHATGVWHRLDEKRWRTDLLERFRSASSPAARQTVLDKFDFGGHLGETAAAGLYRADHRAAAPFILRHLESYWTSKRELWQKLFDAARENRDDEFAFRLYRRQISQAAWEREIAALATQIADAGELCTELERRHPDGFGMTLGMPLYRLVEQRGRDVLPYVQKHLRTVYRTWWVPRARDGYTKLVTLAARHEWWDLWSALVRTCAKREEFNAEVDRLLADCTLGDDETQRRLLMLTGISREWNFGPFGLAQVQRLDDATALSMYQRFPELLRGPFKMNIAASHGLPKLTSAIIDAADELLIDYLASRVVTTAVRESRSGHTEAADRLSRYYEQYREDSREFSLRATNVLGQVPAYTIGDYNQLVRTNRLSRLFYERSAAKYLAYPQGIRDLLEAPEIHAQALALRVLGLDNDEARRLATANLDLLQAMLLRPLHRKTRMLAFGALANAATTVESARRIHHRCRDALCLPDEHYPKEQLIGLIGRLLHDWPELRSPRETPVIHGASA